MYSTRLEGIAQELLDASLCGETPPVDAFELAAACGLHVRRSDVHGALLYDETIYLSGRCPVAQVHLRIAHEIGHWALLRDGADNTEEAADYLAGALLVPRRGLVPSLRAGWDLEDLRRQHIHAPASTIAARIAQVREATAAIYDDGKLRRRVGPPCACERRLLEAATHTGEPARDDAVTGAWPIAGPVRRVIVLAPGDWSPQMY